jgi:hypothetical protein
MWPYLKAPSNGLIHVAFQPTLHHQNSPSPIIPPTSSLYHFGPGLDLNLDLALTLLSQLTKFPPESQEPAEHSSAALFRFTRSLPARQPSSS